MVESKLEIPPPEELADWLRRTRRVHDVTQAELAQRADVSPSQISRLESQSGGTAYETMYRLQQELLTMIADESVTRVGAILEAKQESFSEEYKLVSVAPDETIATAVETMRELQISQLPVITSDGESVGRLTERDLLAADSSTERVKRYMRPPLPEAPADTPAPIARELLETNEALLVTPGHGNGIDTTEQGYLGILTPSDLTENIT